MSFTKQRDIFLGGEGDAYHAEGITAYKTDYASLFLGFPQYVLVEKRSFSHAGERFDSDPGERLAIQVLNKHLAGGYAAIDPS